MVLPVVRHRFEVRTLTQKALLAAARIKRKLGVGIERVSRGLLLLPIIEKSIFQHLGEIIAIDPDHEAVDVVEIVVERLPIDVKIPRQLCHRDALGGRLRNQRHERARKPLLD